ncbi:MAG: hypothetical protein H6737_05805 [Alphaproteobacteria bacterium]|nr:hypothetical protein [Alphaproteobacteria bacterium]
MEDDIIAAGAEIIWVLEADASGVAGTAASCMAFFDQFPTQYGVSVDQGWCVGDGQTIPTPGTFDNSPFSVGRGFDLIVPRDTMRIELASSHGSPSGNDNLSGADILAEVQAIVAGQTCTTP